MAARGRWKKGESGNPAGRPKGIVDKRASLRKQFESEGRAVIERVIAEALDGDMQAAKLVIERLAPPIKSRSEPVEIPALEAAETLADKAQAIVIAVARGECPPDIGSTLISAVGACSKILEIDELERRLTALEVSNQ